MEFLKLCGLFSLIQFLRYFVMAGSAYLIFWKFKNPWTAQHRIQQRSFESKELLREFLYSVLSSVIFGVVLALCFPNLENVLSLKSDQAFWVILFQVVALVLIHDTYFYWMHRFLHLPVLFKWTHKVHHLSTNPSPFAALSFHPIEALLEIIWIWPLVYFFKFEMITWVIFGFVIIFINVLGHLNVELYSRRWKSNAILKYLNYSKDHNEHHKHFHGNYGLYFSIWDRWMKTYRAESYSTE